MRNSSIIALILGFLAVAGAMTFGILEDPMVGGISSVAFLLIVAAGYFLIFLPRFSKRALIENGTPAHATVLEMRDDGWTMGKKPQVELLLEVVPLGEKPYKVRMKMVISRSQADLYQTGSVLRLMVAPKFPKRIAIIGLGDTDSDLGKGMAENIKRDMERIIREGQPAQALILRTWPLGVKVDDNSKIRGFLLEVYPESGPSFQAETRSQIPPALENRYKAGATVRAKYDPKDRTRVALDDIAE